jgi:hypothetical protein
MYTLVVRDLHRTIHPSSDPSNAGTQHLRRTATHYIALAAVDHLFSLDVRIGVALHVYPSGAWVQQDGGGEIVEAVAGDDAGIEHESTDGDGRCMRRPQLREAVALNSKLHARHRYRCYAALGNIEVVRADRHAVDRRFQQDIVQTAVELAGGDGELVVAHIAGGLMDRSAVADEVRSDNLQPLHIRAVAQADPAMVDLAGDDIDLDGNGRRRAVH